MTIIHRPLLIDQSTAKIRDRKLIRIICPLVGHLSFIAQCCSTLAIIHTYMSMKKNELIIHKNLNGGRIHLYKSEDFLSYS